MTRRIRLSLAALALGLTLSSAASAAETVRYKYDARGRMVRVIVDKSGTTSDVQACYQLDKAGNRTNVEVKTNVNAASPPACP